MLALFITCNLVISLLSDSYICIYACITFTNTIRQFTFSEWAASQYNDNDNDDDNDDGSDDEDNDDDDEDDDDGGNEEEKDDDGKGYPLHFVSLTKCEHTAMMDQWASGIWMHCQNTTIRPHYGIKIIKGLYSAFGE